MLLPPPLWQRLSPNPKFLFFPPFRATSTTSIGTSTLLRRMTRWGITWLFLPLLLITLTPLPSIIVLISRPFKLLIRRRLFALSLKSCLPSLNRDVIFSFLPLPPLLLPSTGRCLLPSRRLQFSLILLQGLPREALPGDMTPPHLRLRPRRLLSPPHLRLRPGRLLSLFLSPPIVWILTGSTAPLVFGMGFFGGMGGLGGSRAMGGMGGLGGMQGMGSHHASVPTPSHSSSSLYSSDEAFWAYNFSEPILDAIPSALYPHDMPPHPGGHPHVPASVVPPTAPAVSPLHSLPCGNISTSSASDLTLSGWTPSAGAVPPVVVSAPPPLLFFLHFSCSSRQALYPSCRAFQAFLDQRHEKLYGPP